ncbi:MAG TPA: flagellar protein FlgN [Methylophilaceae bacterium]|jgi:flagella synthesis protein FlgN
MSTVISIDQEAHTVGRLIEVLEHEQGCLIRMDLERMEALLQEKSTLLQNLQQLAQERYQQLAAAGYAGNESGMSEWLQHHGEHAVQGAWLRMQQALLKAKELNRINGMLIGRHVARNQQLLNALQGQSEQFYGPSGQTTVVGRLRGSVVA